MAAAASSACGIPKDTGRKWMDAAKAGHLATLSEMLTSDSRLMHYQVWVGQILSIIHVS